MEEDDEIGGGVVMDIDIERLKTDAAYWDDLEVPRVATHYDKDSGFFCCITGYWTHSHTFKFLQHGHNQWGSGRYIPRPQAPEAEWADGLPPVGYECEVYDPKSGNWNSIIVTAHGEKVILSKWKRFGDQEFILNKSCRFRTIRTKEQRQRDELESIVSDAMIESAQEHSIPRAKDISSAVISAGWKKDA